MALANKKVETELLGRDQVVAEFTVQNSGTPQAFIVDVKLNASGCVLFRERLEEFRCKLLALSEADRVWLLNAAGGGPNGEPNGGGAKSTPSAAIETFYRSLDGKDHVSILLRELVLKLQNRFCLPYQEAELCHCRAVPTAVVDRAIVGGCHSTMAVARTTSAGTSCGTCKLDTELLLAFRLKPL